jgi:uncharacterized protein YjbI with pentapeptide repeats
VGEPAKREWPVRITTLGPIHGATVAFAEAGITYVTVVVKATFALIHEAFAIQTSPEALVISDEAHPGSLTLERASDLAPFVPAVDVTVRGRAFADGGDPVPAVSTRLVVTSSEASGAEILIDKTVHVYGRRAKAGAYPDSFASFPLVYDFAERPSSDAAFGVKPGTVPNLVLPNGERGYAGFGPVAASWPDRQGFLEGATMEETFVGGARLLELSESFPFEYFQVSPPDQRLTGIEGGEWLVIDGMHRDLPRFATKLPHMRAEAQLFDPDGRPLAVHLVCDTLAIDMDARTMNALFRGNIPAPRGPLEALSVVATLEVLANEELDRSVASFGTGAESIDDAAVSEIPPSVPAPESIDMPPTPEVDLEAEVRKTVPPPPANPSGDIPFRAAAGRAPTEPPQARAGLRLGGPIGGSALPFAAPSPPGLSAPLSPSFVDEPTPPGSDEPTASGLPFMVAQAPPIVAPPPMVKAPKAPSSIAPVPAAVPPVQAKTVEDTSDDGPPTRTIAGASGPRAKAELVAGVEARASTPAPVRAAEPPLEMPTTIDDTDARAVVIRRLANGEALYDANFAGADLSGVDFKGAALTGINLTNAKLERCRFDGARLGSAKLAGADLRDASFVGAELGQADLSKCKLAGARFDEALLTDTNLGLADAPNASFIKASGQRTAFAQGQFHEACFDDASLPSSDWSGADLAGASLQRARLSTARFADARGKGVRFDGAELDQGTFVGAQLDGASFAGASMRSASLERAKLEGCSFADAKLGKAMLARCSLDQCTFTGAELDGANFIHATATGGDFDGASLIGADLRQTKLTDTRFERADLRRINAHKASLMGAVLTRANLGGASLRGAKMRGASLEGADLADADLRDADLENAKLVGMVNRERAKLGGANLKGAEDDAPPE